MPLTPSHKFFSSWHVYCLVANVCPTPCDPVDCSLPGSSGHEILQARILECGLPLPPLGDLPDPGIKPVSTALAGRFLNTEPPGKSKDLINWQNREQFCFFFGCAAWHVGSQLPDQKLNLCSVHWKSEYNHWTIREVPPWLRKHFNSNISFTFYCVSKNF